MADDYEKFKKDIYNLTQIDLNSYKERQMRRRIDTLIQRHKIKGYDDFVKSIKTNKDLFDEFVNYLTINVSEFYRNPEQWQLLEDEVIPELIQNFGKRLTVWSAACSTGDEPYSLVMAMSKHLPLNQIRIIATDIDKQVLETAKVGLYNAKSIASVPADLKEKFFEKVGPSYRISDEVKKQVEFREHNLLKDAYPTGCHMIVCRNVVIYFTDEAKNEIYKKFHDSLVKNGVLFIGNTEQIADYKNFGYSRAKSFFYHKEA
jgi:chemotaxis protein methyltransferase CheR